MNKGVVKSVQRGKQESTINGEALKTLTIYISEVDISKSFVLIKSIVGFAKGSIDAIGELSSNTLKIIFTNIGSYGMGGSPVYIDWQIVEFY